MGCGVGGGVVRVRWGWVGWGGLGRTVGWGGGLCGGGVVVRVGVGGGRGVGGAGAGEWGVLGLGGWGVTCS